MFKSFFLRLYHEELKVPVILQEKHFPGLDGLRGISIIIVVLGHVCIGTPYDGFFDGNAAVEIFFVISGFLITTLLLKERVRNGKVNLKQFYIRRFLRIIPVAYLYLIVVLIIELFLRIKISAASFASAFFFFKQYPVISGAWDWNTAHFWSLSVEEQFYLVFPLLMVSNLNRYIKILIGIIVLLPVLELLGFNKIGPFYANHSLHTGTFILINVFGKFVSIAIGALLSVLLFKGIIKIERLPNHFLLTFSALIIAILIHTGRSWIFIPYSGIFIFPLIIGFIILVNLRGQNLLSRILNSRALTHIGVLSYSMYIWQQIFTKNQPWQGLFKYSGSVALNLAALIIVAHVSYYFYEKKFLKLKKHFAVDIDKTALTADRP